MNQQEVYKAMALDQRVCISASSDYKFNGYLVAIFPKRKSGVIRVVVEHDDGILHIFSPKQLELCP